MQELEGNLWTVAGDVKVITTNGDINAKGQAVMGKGTALQAKTLIPRLQFMLAESIKNNGNHTAIVCRQALLSRSGRVLTVVSMPVKHHWHDRASLELIRRSAGELDIIATIEGWERVLLPRPGCGNGGLTWEQVKPIIDWLDDRFVVVNNDGAVFVQ